MLFWEMANGSNPLKWLFTISQLALRIKRHPDSEIQRPFNWGINDSKEIESWHTGIGIIKKILCADYLKNRWPLPMKIVMFVSSFL